MQRNSFTLSVYNQHSLASHSSLLLHASLEVWSCPRHWVLADNTVHKHGLQFSKNFHAPRSTIRSIYTWCKSYVINTNLWAAKLNLWEKLGEIYLWASRQGCVTEGVMQPDGEKKVRDCGDAQEVREWLNGGDMGQIATAQTLEMVHIEGGMGCGQQRKWARVLKCPWRHIWMDGGHAILPRPTSKYGGSRARYGSPSKLWWSMVGW